MEEQIYVVCYDCGEKFDDLAIAKKHEVLTISETESQQFCEGVYEIRPDSEA